MKLGNENFAVILPDKDKEQTRSQNSEPEKPDKLKSPKNYFTESENSCTYLGVEVPKGEGGVLVPLKEAFADYAYTEEDYLLMRDCATSLRLNQPLLVEGGTGLGKTSAVKRMCADLNKNYCLVSFSENTDLMDVIGHKDITIEDGQEVIKWYDGKLIEAIRHGGVGFLDEYNFQGGKIGGRISPIIDSILNGDKRIILPENNNEIIEVHPGFRLIAAQNPPGVEDGQEFTGRDNLSAEKFNRWTFQKLSNKMSPEMESKRMAGMMGEDIEVNIPETEFRIAGEGLPLAELKDIPGMTHWREKYVEIKNMLESKVSARQMARQAQKIYFGPRLGQKIIKYVAEFYRGDTNEAWTNALEYFIVKMFKEETEKEQVRTIINQSLYIPPRRESKRKGLDDKDATDPGQENKSEAVGAGMELNGDFKELIQSEKQSLERFFGQSIDVTKLPAEITKEKIENWEKQGFKLRYLPAMDMSKEKEYPGWKKKPEDWFYNNIKEGNLAIDSYILKAGWVLADERSKPKYDDGKQMYADDPLKDAISELRKKSIIQKWDGKDAGSRFNISNDELQKEEVKIVLAKALNVDPKNIRLPKAIEWNTLGNIHHPEWGETDTREWFEDAGIKDLSGGRLRGGVSGGGGLSDVIFASSGDRKVLASVSVLWSFYLDILDIWSLDYLNNENMGLMKPVYVI